MALTLICVLCIALLANTCDFVTGLHCYTCTATIGSNNKCEDSSFNNGNFSHQTCSYNDAICTQYVIEYSDSSTIQRSCEHKDACARLTTVHNTFYSSLVKCTTCNSDYCNSGAKLELLVVLLASALVTCQIVYLM